ncbi:MAG: hypothetical protein ACYSWQ_14490, partial [Planctomycetota bacterium]
MSNRYYSMVFFVITISAALIAFPSALRGGDGAIPASGIRSTVEADWDRQEKRLGRSASSPEAIRGIMLAAERLLADLSRRSDAPEL